MKERPILFSGEMVRAILDGRKTQTRRVVKGRVACEWLSPGMFSPNFVALPENYLSPYGYSGDLLWVRETWRIVGWHEGEPYLLGYKADGAQLEEPGDSSDYDDDKYAQYSIDSSEDCIKAKIPIDKYGIYQILDNEIPTRWRPSIFMPRWASRLTLRITNVRVEKLWFITEQDILSEGIVGIPIGQDGCENNKGKFIDLWNSINAKRGYPWESNPWVWVINF